DQGESGAVRAQQSDRSHGGHLEWSLTDLGLRTRPHGTQTEVTSAVDTPLVYPARRTYPEGASARPAEVPSTVTRIEALEAEPTRLLTSLQGTSLNPKTFLELTARYNPSGE